MKRQVTGVQFTDGGTIIEFLDPSAMRGNGLGLLSVLHVPDGEPVFAQEVEDLMEAALDLLDHGLEELRRTSPMGDDDD